ncbi:MULTISPECIES: GAF domain-containing protein [unclassified Massilia]|uniref:GAF domain-containing protein n=1 Tax=unclassified Massilia TaxID=2609279 RepID=UPI0017833A9E|nr:MULTISPECIES: GAF domain-containing protein [unclassified Massilia]MBD8532685.1 excisionase family DNA-binding protein [Massilia sp. CFBP 13647]MBD8676046.1 excisionase family DNA-binding protein [Massilia sp. CFBP 13721]
MVSFSLDDGADPVLTTREAAKLLGIAVSTAQQWIENGALPAWKTPGGHRRVRLSAVSTLLRERAGGTVTAGSADPGDFLADAACALPGHEHARLMALRATGLVDSEAEAVFDRLTWLATQVTECPIALLSLVTAHRQWFKSRVGFELPQSAREDAFCNHTINQAGPLVVPDALLDVRFQRNPLVVGTPHVRFYAGFPLVDDEGFKLGALCVMDKEPRRLREREMRALGELTQIAAEEIRRR